MRSFHNKPKIKEQYLNRVKAHAKADEIVKGKYWENGKGCAVGCTVHSSSHMSYQTELGIPIFIAKLEDVIFERLPNEYAMTWPIRFLDAVPIGVDLSMVWPKFTIWILEGVVQYASPNGKMAIEDVKKLFLEWVETGVRPSQDRFITARKAADAAYADAADAAAYAAAAAADAAAYAAAAAADAAAYAAAADAAAAAARNKLWISASEKLIEIIKATGSPETDIEQARRLVR